MDWFIRFTLGLPARVEDAKALHRALPELEKRELSLKPRYYNWPLYISFETNKELLNALYEWISEVDYSKEPEYQDCPSKQCPLKNDQWQSCKEDGNLFTQLMVAVGGPSSKPPKSSFFDLVRNTHPENDVPREVIITDPYIYSDVSEDGDEGGFYNLLSYLEALGLTSDDIFTLRMTPSPKRGTATAKRNLHRFLKKNFKNILIKEYSPQLKFHDRFYVVRHSSGTIRGVFGPSMNGLSSDSIVLMGDIDEIQPLKKLKQWFS